jgi:signal transduction histidine kinase/HAMP domain-containing protein/ActR/RegA family two-component response regulator
MTVRKVAPSAPVSPISEGADPASSDDAFLLELADVLRELRQGRLDVRLPRREGAAGQVIDELNEMAATFERRNRETRRVTRVVGREGRMSERLDEDLYDGAWADNDRSINQMIDDLVRPTAEIARVIVAVAAGDLSQQMALDIEGRPLRGEFLRIGRTVNTMVDQLSSFADEVTRVAREVGTEGKLGGQAQVKGVAGTWRDLTENVNQLAANLTDQVRGIAQVTTAVATGDLSQKITVDARGEILELKSTVNTMVDQLNSFADEVTRVAREVGTEGKLGGQAQVKGVAGTWRDLTENVNQLAGNLTAQVRNIAQVTTAVARGDLSQKITVDARGEILELKSTVNTMVDQLSSFADEVTRVAREVGTEGKLGGQAQVKGVAGTWRDLTENVNQLAFTLTTQLRAIGDVSTAVASGDLTREIQVAALGEVAELKDNINQMIVALRETTKENAEQGWLESNLARVGARLQGQRDLGEVCRMVINEVAPLVNAQIGAFYLTDAGVESIASEGVGTLVLHGGYALDSDTATRAFRFGEGLVGQAASSKEIVLVHDIPRPYMTVHSAIGTVAPSAVVVLPVLFEGEALGVVELGSVSRFSELHLTFLERLVSTIGVTITTIQASRRTEELLAQSQGLALELQEQSAELQRTNAELEDKAELLSAQNRNIEIKNMEIDAARRGVEEKADQLAQASRYKSEFLANMSHELRTPLNSLLLLSRLLAENEERNLTDKQREFASTIHKAGADLLLLIEDILDLSKIEAGRVHVEPQLTDLATVRGYVLQAFEPQAEDKGLTLRVDLAPGVSPTIVTDAQRLQQILRNLLSNAVKFTDAGSVSLTIAPAEPSETYGVPSLDDATGVVSFSVRDTGIGIAGSKLNMIFEAFEQADGTTSRKYGGTGLGLSISRELARLLGGAITVSSEPGIGSTFTLLLPETLPAIQPSGLGVPARLTAEQPPSGRLTSVRAPGAGSAAIAAPGQPRPSERPERASSQPPVLGAVGEGPAERRAVPDLAGVTVLIVDDDVRNVFALTSALELHGLRVLYADNGTDGLRLLSDHRDVDIVLMDAMMPDLDGNETTRMIRRVHGKELPVVFLTAKAMPGDRESSLEAGASDYITKPVDLDKLLAVMASWVTRTGGEDMEALV